MRTPTSPTRSLPDDDDDVDDVTDREERGRYDDSSLDTFSDFTTGGSRAGKSRSLSLKVKPLIMMMTSFLFKDLKPPKTSFLLFLTFFL